MLHTDTHLARLQAITGVEDLIDALGPMACTPGWIERKSPMLWPSTASHFVPAHWRYADIRPALEVAGRVIGTEQAERRNFVLRNPILDNDFATTRTLVAAYQSILPGETARSHRHSSHALRVILDAKGCYSVVNGKRHPMESGDIVLTPGNHWHGHGHDGEEQAYWFDCLDLPLVHLLEPMHYEEYPGGWESDIEAIQTSPMRITSQEIQAGLNTAGTGDAIFGRTVDLTSCLMPTITIKVHGWDAGRTHQAYKHNANQIYVVLRGAGSSEIGTQQFDWSFGDVFVAPMGARVMHRVREDAVLVALSDENLMRHCGFYRLEAC